jgi:gamma-glutamyltranspeptidase/glutathione hydrolase
MRGMVASAHPLATVAGVRMLMAGGNAFDAAVAAAAALGVAEPYMSGLAGMGVACCYVADERRVRALDFVPPVPRRLETDARRGEDASNAARTAGTPGNLAGWWELLSRYGSKSPAEVLQPAIELAREGYPISPFAAEFYEICIERHAAQSEWLDAYTPDRVAPPAGSVLRQPDLAATLEQIAADGPGALYDGPLGAALARHVQSQDGWIGEDDLREVQPRWTEPLATPFQGVRVHTPPPTSEGIQMLLTLRLVEEHLESSDEPAYLDAMVRAIRVAATARIRHTNAPRHELTALLADDAMARMRAEAATVRSSRTSARDEVHPPQHTTALAAGDAQGNLVCLTQSLGGKFGSGLVVPGTGIVLNNLLDWGDRDPDSPNHLSGGRPLSLPIAPTIVTRGGEPRLALGTPGSYTICQAQAQVLMGMLAGGLDVQAAIEAPRLHAHDGDLVKIESRARPTVVEALRACGHRVEPAESFDQALGGMQGVARSAAGWLEGGADPRREGYALGV